MTTSSNDDQRGRHWQSLLSNAPPIIDLATDRPRQAVQSYRRGRAEFRLDRRGLTAVAAHAAATGCAADEAMLGAFLALLHRHTSQDEVVLGVARGDDVEPMPWRFDLSGLPSFSEVLRRVARAGADTRVCPPLGLAELTRQLLPVAGTRHHPLFQVAFVGGAAAEEPKTPPGAVPLDLICLLPEGNSTGTLVYNADLFHEETIARIAGRFDKLLIGLSGAADIPVAAIDLIPIEERRLLVTAWNDTAAEFPADRCLHELFEENVRAQPDAPAVVMTGTQYSYADLDQRANRLAHYLRGLGIRPNDPVALAVERSIEMVVGLVGIAKAGGAYVPLDPNYPHERLMLMLQDSGATVLVTQGHLAERFSSSHARVVRLDDDWETIASERAEPPESVVTPSNLAYVIFTSGSTGRPKCIALDHRGRVNNFHDFNQRFAIGPGDRLLALSSLSFDMTAYDIFGTLMAGGAIVLPTQAEERDPAQWARLMADYRVTVWHSVPALLAMLVTYAEHRPMSAPHSLRLVLLGGDWIPLDLPERIKALVPGVRRISMGGATECSMDSTIYEIAQVSAEWKSIPYGFPMRNQLAFVLDSFGHLVPAGVPGELYLGGIGVAWGYLGRPDLTAARFVPHPYGAPGERLYRTGDLVRYFPDGNLELLGRIDNQVKIRSHRIELGEIVATLNRHPAVDDAVVVVRGERAEEKRLIAYVVPKADAIERLEELQSEQIGQWQSIYQETYSQPSAQDDSTFNVIGWNSSYTGVPIPEPEMKEWVETTVERILARKPRRVLELGCGTGLLLFRIAPHCERYVGIDFSDIAIDGIRAQLATRGLSQVELRTTAADDVGDFAEGTFDCVILNSVTQIFPSIDYLVTVLEGATRLVAGGGFIFVGDNRSWTHQRHLHSTIRLFQAPGDVSRTELRRRVDEAMVQEGQLVIAADFFDALQHRLSRIGRVATLLKRGRRVNEMSQYRYDVFLEIGDGPPLKDDAEVLDWSTAGLTVDRLRAYVSGARPTWLRVNGIPNRRLFESTTLVALLDSDRAPGDVAGLRDQLRRLEPHGVDPEDLYAIGDDTGLAVQVGWSANGRCDQFDALLFRDASNGLPSFPLAGVQPRPWHDYANSPLGSKLKQVLPVALRRYVTDRLPEYMVPSVFVMLDQLPLTPNGKIDRRALPDPESTRSARELPLVPPRTAVEEAVAGIWGDVLGISQVGVKDSFLQLGGHSLLATQVQSRVHELFSIDLPLRHFLGSTSIEEQAGRILAAGLDAGVDAEEIGCLIVQVSRMSADEVKAALHASDDTGSNEA